MPDLLYPDLFINNSGQIYNSGQNYDSVSRSFPFLAIPVPQNFNFLKIKPAHFGILCNICPKKEFVSTIFSNNSGRHYNVARITDKRIETLIRIKTDLS